MKKAILTTGGTGGHIYPALSIADELSKKGYEVLFVGTKHRMEKDLIPKAGYRFIGLDVISLKSPKSFIRMIKATKEAFKIIKQEKPNMVMGFGNYISIPILFSSRIKKIPYYLQEQNSLMGMANKYFYKKAKKIFIAFENTKNYIPDKYKEKFIVSGNPLRGDFYDRDKKEDRKKLNIKDDEKVILIMGGSLGAKSINNSIVEKWDKILNKKNIKLYWGTGNTNYKDVMEKMSNKKIGNNIIVPYFDNTAEIMSASDIVICRSGASTVSELIQLEKASILVPYNFVGQKENAEVILFADAGKMYLDENVNEVIDEALCLLSDSETINFMEENTKTLKHEKAVKIIMKNLNL